MSYISLLNETNVDVDNLASDTLSIATSFSSIGSTTINNTILTGSLSGLATSVANGSDLTYTYNPTTKTFTIQINNNSITPSKLLNASINVNGTIMNLGSNYSLTTDDIPEGTVTKYYTDAKSRLALTGIAPILYNKTTGEINLTTIIDRPFYFNSTIVFYNGNSVQGGPYSAVFGTASSTKSGNIALVDGLTYNSYAQLYCRSRNFGVQGNIDTISLEKPTKIVTSLQISNVALSANYCFIDSTGINIPTGESYKINGLDVDTDDIQESLTPINKYYTDTRARLSISLDSTGSEIACSYANSTGLITVPAITTNSILLTKLKTATPNNIIVCNSVSGIPTYVAISGDMENTNGLMTIGVGAVTTVKVLDANITPAKLSLGSANQFLQTSLSLVNTWVTMSGDASLSNGFLTISSGVISLLKISTSVYSQLASAVSTLVQRTSIGFINVLGVTTTQIELTVPYSNCICNNVMTSYPAVNPYRVPYFNIQSI